MNMTWEDRSIKVYLSEIPLFRLSISKTARPKNNCGEDWQLARLDLMTVMTSERHLVTTNYVVTTSTREENAIGNSHPGTEVHAESLSKARNRFSVYLQSFVHLKFTFGHFALPTSVPETLSALVRMCMPISFRKKSVLWFADKPQK